MLALCGFRVKSRRGFFIPAFKSTSCFVYPFCNTHNYVLTDILVKYEVCIMFNWMLIS